MGLINYKQIKINKQNKEHFINTINPMGEKINESITRKNNLS